ncbi:hypothetical protein KSP39_PZI007701 [Platanthera zijinensis]|uniref:Uncharacterized protein n=1 Tax=Platanthera zijinensis TaxID=2320716 RepID=A0AAP0BM38_9ASPA
MRRRIEGPIFESGKKVSVFRPLARTNIINGSITGPEGRKCLLFIKFLLTLLLNSSTVKAADERKEATVAASTNMSTKGG